MITWATKVTGNTTRMVGFNHKMRKVAELIETNDEWLLKIGSQEFKVNGRAVSYTHLTLPTICSV